MTFRIDIGIDPGLSGDCQTAGDIVGQGRRCQQFLARYSADHVGHGQRSRKGDRGGMDEAWPIGVVVFQRMGHHRVDPCRVMTRQAQRAAPDHAFPGPANFAPDWTKFGGLYRDVNMLVTDPSSKTSWMARAMSGAIGRMVSVGKRFSSGTGSVSVTTTESIDAP